MSYTYKTLDTNNKIVFDRTSINITKLKPAERSIYSIIEKIDDFQSITEAGFKKQNKFSNLLSYRKNELKKIQQELEYYSPDKISNFRQLGKNLLYIATQKTNALNKILQIAYDKESAKNFNQLYKSRVLELQRSLVNFWSNSEKSFTASKQSSDSDFEPSEIALNKYRKNLLESYQNEIQTIIDKTKANPLKNIAVLEKQIKNLLNRVNKKLNPVSSKTQTMRIIRRERKKGLRKKAKELLQGIIPKGILPKNKKEIDPSIKLYRDKLQTAQKLRKIVEEVTRLDEIAKAEYLSLVQKNQRPIFEDIRNEIIYAIEVKLDKLERKSSLNDVQQLQVDRLRDQLTELRKIRPQTYKTHDTVVKELRLKQKAEIEEDKIDPFAGSIELTAVDYPEGEKPSSEETKKARTQEWQIKRNKIVNGDHMLNNKKLRPLLQKIAEEIKKQIDTEHIEGDIKISSSLRNLISMKLNDLYDKSPEEMLSKVNDNGFVEKIIHFIFEKADKYEIPLLNLEG